MNRIFQLENLLLQFHFSPKYLNYDIAFFWTHGYICPNLFSIYHHHFQWTKLRETSVVVPSATNSYLSGIFCSVSDTSSEIYIIDLYANITPFTYSTSVSTWSTFLFVLMTPTSHFILKDKEILRWNEINILENI